MSLVYPLEVIAIFIINFSRQNYLAERHFRIRDAHKDSSVKLHHVQYVGNYWPMTFFFVPVQKPPCARGDKPSQRPVNEWTQCNEGGRYAATMRKDRRAVLRNKKAVRCWIVVQIKPISKWGASSPKARRCTTTSIARRWARKSVHRGHAAPYIVGRSSQGTKR
jgi:hypothetical protein